MTEPNGPTIYTFSPSASSNSLEIDIAAVALPLRQRTEQNMPLESQRLSIREKIGYSLGDSAANFVFMTMILFQLNYPIGMKFNIQIQNELAERRKRFAPARS